MNEMQQPRITRIEQIEERTPVRVGGGVEHKVATTIDSKTFGQVVRVRRRSKNDSAS